MHLTYEYELNAMTSKQPVDFEAIAPMLQRRYCTDPEFELAAANKVPVTWEYLRRRATDVQEALSRTAENRFKKTGNSAVFILRP